MAVVQASSWQMASTFAKPDGAASRMQAYGASRMARNVRGLGNERRRRNLLRGTIAIPRRYPNHSEIQP